VQVVLCPQCNVELDHDAEDVGYLVECPACLNQFVATTDRTGDALTKPVAPPVETPVVEAPVVAAVIVEEAPSASKPTVEARDTIQTECRVCQGLVTIDTTDIGHRVECPLCQQLFLATAKNWKKPSRRTEEEDEDDEDDDERNLSSRELRKKRQEEQDEFNPKRMLRNAKGDLGSVAGAVTVLGWIDIVCGILSIIIGIIFLVAMMNTTAPVGLTGTWMYLNIFPGIGGVLLGTVKVFGGAAMKNIKSRNMALLACWASLLPLNIGACLSFFMFPAYFVSLVFGIIGLVNMNKMSVKKAFEFNKPDGDMDAF
jgi:DNA-directed RNA polymerase subunit M/transcription elongation factor TFIIS/phage FluMu protein Com